MVDGKTLDGTSPGGACGSGGGFSVKKRWGWVDIVALGLALLTFGVIVAVLVQNFLNLEL